MATMYSTTRPLVRQRWIPATIPPACVIDNKTVPHGAGGYRSRYLVHAKHALYHLSYSPSTYNGHPKPPPLPVQRKCKLRRQHLPSRAHGGGLNPYATEQHKRKPPRTLVGDTGRCKKITIPPALWPGTGGKHYTKCTSRESNPGHIDGNDVFYH